MHRRQQFWFDPEKVQGMCLEFAELNQLPRSELSSGNERLNKSQQYHIR